MSWNRSDFGLRHLRGMGLFAEMLASVHSQCTGATSKANTLGTLRSEAC